MDRLHIVAAMAAMTAMVACGAVRTFTGATNGNWNNADNWEDGNLPANGDYVIDASAQATRNNNIGELSLNGLEFTGTWDGNATFAGSNITLLEGAAVTNATGRRLLCDVRFVLEPGMHDFHISGSGNPRVDIRVPISGEGGVLKTGNGMFAVSVTTTFTGGFRMAGEGTTYYTGASASIGAASSPMVFERGAKLYLYASGLVIPNPVTFEGETGTSGNIFVRYPATFSGTVTLAADGCTRIKNTENSTDCTVRFSGDVIYTGTGCGMVNNLVDNLASEVHFDRKLDWPTGTYSQNKACTTCFNAESNVFASLDIQAGNLRFAKDAITAANDILFSAGSSSCYAFDGDNTIRRLATTGNGGGTHSVTSSVPCTLTVHGTQNDTFAGTVDGAITIDWQPASNYALTFTRGGNTVGGLKAAAGTLILDGAVFPNISSIELSSGTTLEFENGASVNTRLDTLSIPSTASLSGLANTEFSVDSYVLNGVEMTDGTTYDLGNGNRIYVIPRPGPGTKHVWDGGGGADTSFALAANWSGDATPAFGPKVLASFEGGTAATLTAQTELNGFEFNLAGDFTVDGAFTAGLYWGGITAPAAFWGHTATIAAPVVIERDQFWSIADGATVAVTGGILAGADPAKIVKDGEGTLTLAASNTMTGDLVISNGTVAVLHDEALGDSSSGAVYLLRNAATALPAALSFGSCTISRDIHLEGPDNNYYPMYNTADSTNLFTGKIYIDDSSIKRIRSTDRSVMTFAGGVESTNAMFYLQGRGKYEFTAVPVNVKSFYSDIVADFSLSAPGNRVGAMTLKKDTVFRVDTDNVFASAPELSLSDGAVMDMNGHNVTLNNLKSDSDGGVAYIRSASAALLSVTQNSGGNANVVLDGSISLSKNGPKTLGLCAANTSTGSLHVVGGLLLIDSSGVWKGSEVTVDGILRFNAGAKLAGRRCVVNLQNGGKLGLNAGVDITVGRLVVNGVQMPNGTYGSTKSSATYKNDSMFETYTTADCTGILRVVGQPGMMISFY